jgi:hypothetical protein
MAHFTVDLGNGRRVGLSSYVRAWKEVKRLPPETRVKCVPGQWWPGTVSDVLVELERGLHDRINMRLPGYGVGRKWQQDWQAEAARTARAANDRASRRIRMDWVPMEWRTRLAHLMDDK